mgnify:CR=1 FL=1
MTKRTTNILIITVCLLAIVSSYFIWDSLDRKASRDAIHDATVPAMTDQDVQDRLDHVRQQKNPVKP